MKNDTKNMKRNIPKAIVFLLLWAVGGASVKAQQGFGTNTPAASAVVDMTATNKGVLLPRVALTATTVAAPVSAPATNLVVFNTATAGDVTPGLYFWTGTVWKRQMAKGDTGNDWQRTGNAGTNPSVNALGTNDAQSLVIKTNNAERMRISSSGNVGINTASPNSSALLDVSSTTQVFLPPRMTSAQIAAIASPAEGLIVYNTDMNCAVYYAKGTFNSFSTTPFTCGNPMTVTHTVGSVAPITKTVTYGTVLTSITGSPKCWITQNLGATNQASSVTDATEPSAGWYWQYNRARGYMINAGARSPSTAWDISLITNSYWLQDNDPCALLLGLGWRIPTITEWQTADTWSSYDDSYASVLKLHAAGELNPNNGSPGEQGGRGLYWANSLSSTTANGLETDALYLNLASGAGQAFINGAQTQWGFTLRCLRD